MLFKCFGGKIYIDIGANSLIMSKKGDFSWEQLGKIALAVLGLLVLLIIIGLLTSKSESIFDTVKDFVRFGR